MTWVSRLHHMCVLQKVTERLDFHVEHLKFLAKHRILRSARGAGEQDGLECAVSPLYWMRVICESHKRHSAPQPSSEKET